MLIKLLVLILKDTSMSWPGRAVSVTCSLGHMGPWRWTAASGDLWCLQRGLLWVGVHASAQPAGQEALGPARRWSLPTTGHWGRGLRGHPLAQYCPTAAGHPFPPGVCVLKDTGGSRKQLRRGEAQRGGASSPSAAPFSSRAGCTDLDQSFGPAQERIRTLEE